MDELIYAFLTDLPLLILFVTIGVSLYVLGKGADILVNEAIGLSVRWGIPQMIIGATLISLGTTVPELTVSVSATINGNLDLALGNAIGSIITNTGLILGLAALVGKLSIDKKSLGKQGLIQLLAAFLLAFVSLPFLSSGSEGIITQKIGFVFIGLLIIYTIYTIIISKKVNYGLSTKPTDEDSSIVLQIVKMFAGVVLVVIASKILIPSVEITAIQIGIPEGIIAATLVAFGTSLPELVTSVTAVKKGHGDLAIGNITGANILNILFVVGSSAAVSKSGLPVYSIFYKLQIPTMLIMLTLFYIFSKDKKEVITKFKGLLLLGIYIVYIILNYIWM